MKKFIDKHLEANRSKRLNILDVGSQDVNGTYRPLFNNPHWRYTGLDMTPGPNVDIVVKDVYNWKEIRSSSYDVVISGQALEHIEFFWVTMNEIARVLRQEGVCCIIAPSSGPEHRYPKDCWRFFPDGLTAAAKYATLEILEVYACQEPIRDGEENVWRDTVLVARKTRTGFCSTSIFSLRNTLLKLISKRPRWLPS
ncbi:methyltransferase domain-containing protein [Chloroflexota bacterium]